MLTTTATWVLALAMLTQAGGVTRKETWKKVVPEGGDYQIMFPAAPKPQTSEIPVPNLGQIKINILSVDSKDRADLVNYSDYPADAKFNVAVTLKSACDGTINGVPARRWLRRGTSISTAFPAWRRRRNFPREEATRSGFIISACISSRIGFTRSSRSARKRSRTHPRSRGFSSRSNCSAITPSRAKTSRTKIVPRHSRYPRANRGLGSVSLPRRVDSVFRCPASRRRTSKRSHWLEAR